MHTSEEEHSSKKKPMKRPGSSGSGPYKEYSADVDRMRRRLTD